MAEVQQEHNRLWPDPAPAANDRSPWPGLLALMAVAAVLRAIALDQQLWYDEMTTLVQSVRRPLGEILTSYTSQNQHLLYSVLARVSMTLLGDHIWTLRLPAVLFGVAAVPTLYFCARQWTTVREAWLACLLLTVSYHHIWFSQNARGYTGMVLWTLLATGCFVHAALHGTLRAWTCYAVTLALGMYTHLTMGFVAAGHFLVAAWLVWNRRDRLAAGRRPFIGFVFAGVFSALLYLPVLPSLLQKTVVQASKASVESEWTNPLWTLIEAARGLAAGAGGRIGWIVLPLATLVLLSGLVSYWRTSRAAVALMVVPGLLTAAVMLGLGHNLWPRFFFFAIGFGFLLLVRGATRCGEWAADAAGQSTRRAAWGGGLALLLIGGSAATVRSAWIYPKQDFAGALRFVEGQRQPEEPVLLAGLATFPYREYYRRDWTAVETRAEIAAAQASGRPVWLLATFPIHLQSRYPDVWKTVTEEFTTVRVFRGTIGDGEVRVYRWDPAARPAPPEKVR